MLSSEAQAGICISFDDLEAGQRYKLGEVITSSGVRMRVLSYVGQYYFAFAAIRETTPTGDRGNEVLLRQASLAFDYFTLGSLNCVYLRFRHLDGGCYLRINEESISFNNPYEIHGATLGGVHVYVYPLEPTAADSLSEGYLILSGEMGRTIDPSGKWALFIIGGHNLAIDCVCPGR